MSKGIIVIDIPECCDKCPAFERKTYSCGCTWNDILRDFEEYEEERSPDCPLKPLPQYMTMENVVSSDYNEAFVNGFNYCLDDILGDTE